MISLTSLMLLHDIIVTEYWRHSVFTCLQFTLPVNYFSLCKIMGFSNKDKILIKNSHDSKGTDGTMPKERYQFPEKGWGKSGLSCSVVSARDKSVVWMNWNSSSLMSGGVLNSRFLTAIDQWQGKLRACVYAKGGHYEYTAWELTMLILSIPYLLHLMWLGWLLHL